MKKILVICATVATLGAAAFSSVQARILAADDPAVAAIPGAYPGQPYNQPNATRNPHNGEGQGACYPERTIDAWGFEFRVPRESGAVC